MSPRLGTVNSMRTRPKPWLCMLVIVPLRMPSFSITTPTNSSGTSMVRFSTGSISLVVDALGDDLRLADHQFVAFAAHHFDQDGELQFAASHHLESVRTAGLFHAKRNVGQQFFVEALAKIARGHVLAFASGKGRRIDGELHRDGGFVDDDARQRRRIFEVGDGVADGDAGDASDGDDVSQVPSSVISTRFRPLNENSFVILTLSISAVGFAMATSWPKFSVPLKTRAMARRPR